VAALPKSQFRIVDPTSSVADPLNALRICDSASCGHQFVNELLTERRWDPGI